MRQGLLHSLLWIGALAPGGLAATEATFPDTIEPILVKYCFDCHGDGTDKGDVSLDFADDDDAVTDLELWERVWHNVDSHLMPPAGKKQPTTDELHSLTRWIGKAVFKLDPANPDPGRVTVRRLNREEYRYSVRDLLGVDFRVEDNFPSDDTGYGFDTIGDVLSLSPLLLEKYLSAAQEIVANAVPWESGKIPFRNMRGEEFKSANGEAAKAYARKILRPLAEQAFRRPVDDGTLNRLVQIALLTGQLADTSFEEGIQQAIAGILVSPRFLFRAETQPQPNDPGKVVELDEFALASRLSYFLWSSLPDAKLLGLARKGELRRNLGGEVDRMIQDPKFDRFVSSFVGQWLQARDVPTINVSAKAILRLKDQEEGFRIFNGDVRRDMQREPEMLFAHLIREKRPVTELINANYTFLSGKLAAFYGINGVEGREMRKVELKPEHRRGGILRQGNFLVVTSNPTRTSPVKRGLFVLENVLATPAPPAPPNVPALEAAKKPGMKNPTVRELMELHRQDAVCASCHDRMDPLGLAFENYNAIGQWRDDEDGKPIDPAGKLVTGETFRTVEQLIEVLSTSRKHDVVRAMVEKIMIYALGRGLEYYDRPEIDRIAAAVDSKNGTMRAVIDEVIASPAFQKRRGDGNRVALRQQ